jgi:hypothetical protein
MVTVSDISISSSDRAQMKKVNSKVSVCTVMDNITLLLHDMSFKCLLAIIAFHNLGIGELGALLSGVHT